MKNIVRRVTAGMAMVVVVALGGTAPAWAVDDLASITCHNKADSSFPHGPHYHTAGSGVGYPRSTQIDIIWHVVREGKFLWSKSARLYTSSTGSWSRPSDISLHAGSYNRYHIEMWTYSVSTGRQIGYDWDECYMVPPAKTKSGSSAAASHLR
jgi:hypothetical protein